MGHRPRGLLAQTATAWEYFPHDHARSRAYRWSEDGLAGICDSHQQVCFALALWNGRDPILKERLFGLTDHEGHHGEDVKEYYFYLDSTPTHSYMKYLYKYPQARVSVRRAHRGQPPPQPRAIRNTSCSTPACSTTTATSTSSWNTQRPAPRICSMRHHGRQPRSRRAPTSTCCRRSGSATPGRGASTCGVRGSASMPAAERPHVDSRSTISR